METGEPAEGVQNYTPGRAARAGKFYLVGGLGLAVQLGALWVYRGVLGIPYLWATVLAVETAVLHNYVWHERWTWSDRRTGQDRLGRVLRFHLTNGLLSLGGNLVIMRLLVGVLQMHYLVANVISIAACAVANFLLAEWFVFRRPAGG